MRYVRDWEELLEAFIHGERELQLRDFEDGSLRISGNQVVYNDVPVLESPGDGEFILNVSVIDPVTEKYQIRLRNDLLADQLFYIAYTVPKEYRGSLVPFISQPDDLDDPEYNRYRLRTRCFYALDLSGLPDVPGAIEVIKDVISSMPAENWQKEQLINAAETEGTEYRTDSEADVISASQYQGMILKFAMSLALAYPEGSFAVRGTFCSYGTDKWYSDYAFYSQDRLDHISAEFATHHEWVEMDGFMSADGKELGTKRVRLLVGYEGICPDCQRTVIDYDELRPGKNTCACPGCGRVFTVKELFPNAVVTEQSYERTDGGFVLI